MQKSYLVAVGCEEGSYKEEMLKNSRIPGLLRVTGQDFNGKHELWYETTAMQALKTKFSQKAPGVEEITELMRQIGGLAQKLEEYLLEAQEIVPRLSCIFEGQEGEFLFLYAPGYNKENAGGICRLLEELMEYVDYEEHRAVSFLYLLHARSRQQTCGIHALQRLCAEIAQAAWAEEEERKEDDFFGEFMEMEDVAEEKNRIPWRERAAGYLGGNGKTRGSRTGGKSTEKTDGGRTGSKSAEKKDGSRTGSKSAGKMDGSRMEAWREGEADEKTAKKADTYKTTGGFHGLLQKLKGYIKSNGKSDVRESVASEELLLYGRLLDGEAEEYKAPGQPYELQKYGNLYGDSAGDTVLLTQEECPDTVLLGEGSDTILLQEQERFVLEPEEKGRESILLTNFPFYIGKEEMGIGYAFQEPIISRRHAKILKEGMRYFLMDTKSLNGTYLNGERLVAEEKKELKDGDQINFADICFIFTCCKSPNGI